MVLSLGGAFGMVLGGMATRVSNAPAIPVTEAARDFRRVLKIVDRKGFVRLTKNGRTLYHVGREVPAGELLRRLKTSVREHEEGKTRLLRSLADLR